MSAAGSTRWDAIVLGSGVAGASTALHLAGLGARVVLATKAELEESTTAYAQGGIAVAFSELGDDPALHLADTLRAGAGLCDPAAARVLVEGAPAAVAGLLACGARLDRELDGTLARSREGGHSLARVVHAGGAATGAEIVHALSTALRGGSVELRTGWFARRLLVEGDRCVGVEGETASGELEEVRARAVVLATGGAGQLFALTTNPLGSTGDGIALALRAGIPVADLEFVQFHPTALAMSGVPRPLLSEALRGEGALLLDGKGRRFVDELLPRDVVARAIATTMASEGSDHVLLDARSIQGFAKRFPSLARVLAEVGLDPERDLLPVAPAAHYLCGGVLTDLDGATALPGCYAVGEVACTGVHGANRLASNSLLEGLVFAPRVAEAITKAGAGPSPTGALGPLLGECEGALALRRVTLPSGVAPKPPGQARGGTTEGLRRELASAMSSKVGVERDAGSLSSLASSLQGLATRAAALEPAAARDRLELVNLLDVARAMVALATERAESRGAHYRRDHPEPDDAFRCRLVVVPNTHRGAEAPAAVEGET
jgi:L-aspartate oxidase